MDKKIRIISIISLFLCGYAMNEKEDQHQNYEIYVNQIVQSFAKDMNKKYGLVCNGSGGR